MKVNFTMVCLISLSFSHAEAQNTNFEKQVAESKQAAIREFPDLKDTTSQLFQYVQYATKELPKLQADCFKDPTWPLTLARACSLQLQNQNQNQKVQKQQAPEAPREGQAVDAEAVEFVKGLMRWQNQQAIQQLEAARALSRNSRDIKRFDEAIAALRMVEPPVATPQQNITKNQLYAGAGGGHWIKENINRGEMILLEDGSLWKIDPLGKIDSMLWLKLSRITIIESSGGSPGYNYALINTDDKGKVHAQYLGKN